MCDDACEVYGPQTIGMLAVVMEYDRPIATNYDFIFVEVSYATMITHDTN